MKRMLFLVAILAAVLLVPTADASAAKRHTNVCTHRAKHKGKCQKTGHVCVYWAHGKRHRAKFCDRKPQVVTVPGPAVIVHDTTAFCDQGDNKNLPVCLGAPATCNCPPPPCQSCGEGKDDDHDDDHGHHGHEGGKHGCD
jgi:hypothetical protein